MSSDRYGRKKNRRTEFRPTNLLMAAVACVAFLLVLFLFWPAGYSEQAKPLKFTAIQADQLNKVAVQSDGSQLDYFRKHILQPFLRVRVPDTEGSRLVQQHIENEMRALRWHVELDSFVDSTPFGPKTFTNIIAVQNPAATRRLTLACHFDSKYFSQFEFIGATDSAVPCALLIDLARHLNTAFYSSKLKDTTLQLLFFDGEEAFVDWTETDSLYGARHHAEKIEKELVQLENGETVSQLQRIDVLILLDLIGTESTTFRNWFPQTGKIYERLQKIEMRLANEGLLAPSNTFQGRRSNTYFSSARAFGGVSDDHIPFIRRGVPVVHLISTPFPSVWHTAGDNESVLHYDTINNVGKILRVFVAEYLQLTV